jgi:uncharacterized Zn-binding protein involved in type VI secretion
MPVASVLGDMCSGHACWPSRCNIQASDNVFCEGIGSHRQGDAWAVHCCVMHRPPCPWHSSVLALGSATVYVNGRQMGRIGDPVACGSVDIGPGAPTVIVGG